MPDKGLPIKISFARRGGLGGLPLCWIGNLDNIRFAIPTDIAYTRKQALRFTKLIIYLARDILNSGYTTQHIELKAGKAGYVVLIEKDPRTEEINISAYRNTPFYH